MLAAFCGSAPAGFVDEAPNFDQEHADWLDNVVYGAAVPYLLLTAAADLPSVGSSAFANLLWASASLIGHAVTMVAAQAASSSDVNAFRSTLESQASEAWRRTSTELHHSVGVLLHSVAALPVEPGALRVSSSADLISSLWGACALLSMHRSGAVTVANNSIGGSSAGLERAAAAGTPAAASSAAKSSTASGAQGLTGAGGASALPALDGALLQPALDGWCDELAGRLGATNTAGGELVFQPEDLADLAAAVAAAAPFRSGAMGRLLDAVAHEAYRQVRCQERLHALSKCLVCVEVTSARAISSSWLIGCYLFFSACPLLSPPSRPLLGQTAIFCSAHETGKQPLICANTAPRATPRQVSNRHSLNASFMPGDLLKLTCAYADLGYKHGPAGEALSLCYGVLFLSSPCSDCS